MGNNKANLQITRERKMSPNEKYIKSLTRNIIQKILYSEFLAWPPTTPFGIYQPHRPDQFLTDAEKREGKL